MPLRDYFPGDERPPKGQKYADKIFDKVKQKEKAASVYDDARKRVLTRVLVFLAQRFVAFLLLLSVSFFVIDLFLSVPNQIYIDAIIFRYIHPFIDGAQLPGSRIHFYILLTILLSAIFSTVLARKKANEFVAAAREVQQEEAKKKRKKVDPLGIRNDL